LPIDAGDCAYSNPAVLDLTMPDRAILAAAVQAIEARKPNGKVLVCCALGYSRSAIVVAAWLTATGRAPDADAAIARIRVLRPHIVLSDAHRALIAT
jgi:protein-tyrosine phosphatase